MSDSIKELQAKITKFRDDRDWKQFHNPKDLAISISLEAAELLEIFQWSGSDTSAEGKKEKVEEELADVMMYSILMADRMGLDISEIINKKLETNIKKYPVDKAFGKSNKYTEL
ncbi:MAG TPA: nucleotide pyrophosphohydrolase [Lachnospiraceae bacterium]|nr:nucleotide pyrophosphohydrolase [Lachnospiraceae bacterium]